MSVASGINLDSQRSSLLSAQWMARALSERDAYHRFSALALLIKEHPQFSVLTPAIDQAAIDEERHIGLCMHQVRRFGVAQLPPYRGFKRYFDSLLCELVTLFCVMETINAALLVSLKENLEDTSLRAVCHEILRDEVQHARIGWAALSLSLPEERHLVWSNLTKMFLAAGIHKVDREDVYVQRDVSWGIFDREHRVSLLETTMKSVIFPGFWQMGLSQDISWEKMRTQFLNIDSEQGE